LIVDVIVDLRLLIADLLDDSAFAIGRATADEALDHQSDNRAINHQSAIRNPK
jgi:hypothetical protein